MIQSITQAPYIQRNPKQSDRHWKQIRVSSEKFGPYLEQEMKRLKEARNENHKR